MALAWERWNSMVTFEEEEEEGEEGEEPEVEGAPLLEVLPPASGLRRMGPVGSPEATVTAETAARRAWRGGGGVGWLVAGERRRRRE